MLYFKILFFFFKLFFNLKKILNGAGNGGEEW